MACQRMLAYEGAFGLQTAINQIIAVSSMLHYAYSTLSTDDIYEAFRTVRCSLGIRALAPIPVDDAMGADVHPNHTITTFLA